MSIQTVKLYGQLANQFGEELRITGKTVTRVLSIIEANFSGQFYASLRDGEYFVWTEDADGNKRGFESPDDLITATSNETLHIMPVIEGASNNKGGIIAILGVILVGVAIVATGGVGLVAALEAGGLWGTAAQLGIGMAISGIGAILSPMPDLTFDNDPEDQQQSYILGGPINTMNEGGAIPVLYGKPIVGSTVISGGIDIEQIAVEE